MNRSGKAETLSYIGCGRGFGRNSSLLGLQIIKGKADITVIGERGSGKAAVNAVIAFLPDSCTSISGGINCVSAVSAGMGPKATLSFSSIGDDTAVLSVNREIDFFGNLIEPCEIPVNFIKSLSIYENMIYGFLIHFL